MPPWEQLSLRFARNKWYGKPLQELFFLVHAKRDTLCARMLFKVAGSLLWNNFLCVFEVEDLHAVRSHNSQPLSMLEETLDSH
jgi:hypothetical protein